MCVWGLLLLLAVTQPNTVFNVPHVHQVNLLGCPTDMEKPR